MYGGVGTTCARLSFALHARRFVLHACVARLMFCVACLMSFVARFDFYQLSFIPGLNARHNMGFPMHPHVDLGK